MTQDRIWLVRSSGKILGPYGFEEVAALIGAHEVSILDEIRDPDSRWNFVREHKKFSKLVNEIRTKEAQFLDQETETGARSKTVKDYDLSDELTPRPAAIPAPQRPAEKVTQTPSYSFSGTSSREFFRNWFLGLVLTSLVFFGLYLFEFHRDIDQKSMSADDFIKIAKLNKSTGSYERALEFYRKAEALGPLDLYSKMQMASLLIEVNNQTLEARKIVDDVLAKVSGSDAARTEAQLIQGLSYFREANYLQAEQIYKSILFSDAKQSEARANIGLIHLMRSEFDAANRELLTLQKEGYSEPMMALASSFISLGLNENKPDADVLKTAIEDLDRLNRRSAEYRLEAQLIKAVVAQKLQDSNRAEKTIEALLEDDPNLSRDHIHNLFLDRQLVSWERLSMYCDFLTSKLKEGPISRGLSSYCSFQKEETNLAIKKIEEARNQFPKSGLLIGLHAYYLLSTHRLAEGKQLAEEVLESSQLAKRVYAEVCLEQKDWGCAEKSWSDVMASQVGDAGALRALAFIQYSKHSPERALDFIKTGLVKAPNYKPLLDLRTRLDNP